MGILARNPHEEEEEREDDQAGEPVGDLDDVDGGLVLREIDHVALVVEDLDEAIADHRDLYGVLVDHREELHDEGAEVAFLEVGGSSIALIAPVTDDSEYREFLDEGGPGLHHLAYRVDDLDVALDALREAGRELIDEEPVAGPRGARTAYLHPDSAFGVLVQLVER